LQASAEKLITDTDEKLEESRSRQQAALDAQLLAAGKKSDQTLGTFQETSQSALNAEQGKFDTYRTGAQKQQKELIDELEKLEQQIRDSIRRATGYGLFSSFQTRQQDLVAAKRFWSRALTTVVGISILFSMALIVDLTWWHPKDYGAVFFLKLSISLPLIYAITFCNVQYSRERRLEEEYAFKSSISISLDPYRELVEKLVLMDVPEERAKYTAFIIESVGRVFTSPMERVFDDHPKESKSVEGTLKLVHALLNDVVKLIKR
jgi:hypothetical protein